MTVHETRHDSELRIARSCGLTPEGLRHLRSLVDQRARNAWELGDFLCSVYGPPPVQGRNDASGLRLTVLAEVLGVSVSWLVRLRVTSHAWPSRERRVSVAWTVSKHLATRPDRFAVLDAYVRWCEGEKLTPSLERLLGWLDEHAVPTATIRRRDEPFDRALKAALRLDHDALLALIARLTAALETEIAA